MKIFPPGGWLVTHLKSYLKTCSISLGKRIRDFSEANLGTPPCELKERFMSLVIPESWSRPSYPMSNHLNPLMHNAFHGIAAGTMGLLVQRLSFFPIKNSRFPFDRLANIILEEIKSLSLQHFKPKPFTASTETKFSMKDWYGGNKTALAFILPTIMSHAYEYICYFSTQARLGDAQYMQSLVDLLDAILDFVHSFECLAARLLSRTVNKRMVSEVTEYTKLFITQVTRFELETMPPGKTQMLSGGNLLTLLNFAEDMKMMGSLRNFWDFLGKKK